MEKRKILQVFRRRLRGANVTFFAVRIRQNSSDRSGYTEGKEVVTVPAIYLDVLLALNWLTDFLLLSAVARLRHLPHKRGRLVLGAAVGSLGSLVILLPTLPMIAVALWDLGVAALMIAAAFPFRGKRNYFTSVASLFVLSALFGGISYLLWLFFAPRGFYVLNGAVYYDVSPLTLVAATLVSYAAVTLYDKLTRRTPPPAHTFRVEVRQAGATATLRALHDTGQRLTECFSGSPVLVVRQSAVKPLLPDGFDNWASKPNAISGARVRLIPFTSVGGSGLLPAFRPDDVTLIDPLGVRQNAAGAYIAVTKTLGRGDYDALLGDDLIALFDERSASH